MSKSNKKPVVSAFSLEFCNDVKTLLDEETAKLNIAKRDTISRKVIAAKLSKRANYGVRDINILALMVGGAVGVGAVSGYLQTPGRNGGIYNHAKRLEWNAAVAAENAAVAAE